MFSPDVSQAILLSLRVAAWCAVLGAPPAIAVGWWLARARFRGRGLVTTVVLAPLVLPPVVTGLLLLRLFGARSALGSALAALGLQVPFSLAGVVLAALVVGFPLYVLSARAAFEGVDRRFEESARTLGRSRFDVFWRISLPLAAPGILAGALLAFARALGEFGATAVLAGNIEGRTRTISLAIYTLLESPDGDGEINRLVWASLALTGLALAGAELVRRRARHD
jgi:molybdate transport system permease protein